MRQFDRFQAAQLFCSKCKTSVEVREVLLLVLPGKNLYDYRCAKCGSPVGTREEIDPEAMSLRPRPPVPPAAPPPRRGPSLNSIPCGPGARRGGRASR